jgi:TIR domain-containing protein
MRRWFLSYHSPDQALAERLKAALERKDTGAHVFFAPSSLRAGGFWSRALAEEIAQADAFILLVGDSELIRTMGSWFGLMPFSGVKPQRLVRIAKRREGEPHGRSPRHGGRTARSCSGSLSASSHYDPVK